MAAKRRKMAPIAWRWLAAVQDDEEHFDKAEVAVCAVLARTGDADGRNIFASVDTIARRARYTERGVQYVLRRLVAKGAIKVTRKANQHRPTTYALVIFGIEEDKPGVSLSSPLEEPRGVVRGEPGVSLGAPYLPPPTRREEEEGGAGALGAQAPSAAPLPKPTIEIDPEVMAICREIAKRSRQSIEVDALAPAVAAKRPRWPDRAIEIYCVDKLRQKGRVAMPAQFLAADLNRLNGDLLPSPRMLLAQALQRVEECDEQAEAEGDTYAPLGDLDDALAEAGLIAAGDPAPDVWDVKPAQIERMTAIANRIVSEFNKRRKPEVRRPKPDPFDDF